MEHLVTMSLRAAGRSRLVLIFLTMVSLVAAACACTPGADQPTGGVPPLLGHRPSTAPAATTAAGSSDEPRAQDSSSGGYGDPSSTVVVLAPHLTSGDTLSAAEMDQLITALRHRVEDSGRAGATVTTPDGEHIVIELPGWVSDDDVAPLAATAQLRFRPVLRAAPGFLEGHANTSWLQYDGASAAPPLPPSPTAAPGGTGLGVDPAGDLAAQVAAAMSFAQVTDGVRQRFEQLSCTSAAALAAWGGEPADQPLVTCSQDGTAKYILGPVVIEGSQVSSAVSSAEVTQQGTQTERHQVMLKLDSTGTQILKEASGQMMDYRAEDGDAVAFWSTTGADGTVLPGTVSDLFTDGVGAAIPDRNHLAIVLDGLVVSAPAVQSQIADGSMVISGSFTPDQAASLADQLVVGALPVAVQIQSITH